MTLTPAEMATPAVPPATLIVNVAMSSRFVAASATPRRDCWPGLTERAPESDGSVASELPSLFESMLLIVGVWTSPWAFSDVDSGLLEPDWAWMPSPPALFGSNVGAALLNDSPKLPSLTSTALVVPSPENHAPAPVKASVALLTTLTAPEAATPAVPDTASTPTILSISVWSSAVMTTLPPACTWPAPAEAGPPVGSSPIHARVWFVTMCTDASRATDAVPLRLMPAATEVTSSLATALTSMSPSTSAVTLESM